MYTIGQVSKMMGLPISTLRYYDREGLLPDLKRHGNTRRFDENDLEALRVIECLKLSGLEIKDIRQFMAWAEQGAETYSLRKQLFEERREAVEAEMRRLRKSLDMIEFKCWYYERAIADGNEDGIEAMLPDKLPPEIQRFYDNTHGDEL